MEDDLKNKRIPGLSIVDEDFEEVVVDVPKVDAFEYVPADMIGLIALALDPPSIASFCQSSRKFNRVVCHNENFWRNKLAQDYGIDIQDDQLSWFETYKLYYQGNLYMFGTNSEGQLGDGTKESSNEPVWIEKLGIYVAMVSCGSFHTGVVTREGALYMFGENLHGQLGTGTNKDSNLPVHITNNVAMVSCGSQHTGVVTRDNKLFMFGFGIHGQLGNGSNQDSNTLVHINLLGNTVAMVSCGGHHTGVVTTDGTLYMFGNNIHGQLGNRTLVDSNKPVMIVIPNKTVAMVSCGAVHTGVVTTDESLYMFGRNYSGQLGNGLNQNSDKPLRIDFFGNNVAMVSCGDHHTGVVTKDGSLYMFGYNSVGQLGDGTTNSSNIPVLINSLGNNVAMVNGGEFHTGVVTKDGDLFMFGSSEDGQLGNGTDQNSTIPVHIDSLRNVAMVSCGAFHTGVIAL